MLGVDKMLRDDRRIVDDQHRRRGIAVNYPSLLPLKDELLYNSREEEMHHIPSEILLSVLVYRSSDVDCWAALALEMDIRGYGDTPMAAFNELQNLVHMQISFAAFKEAPSLIWKRAEPIWFERFADAHRQQLESKLLRAKPVAEPEYTATGMTPPPPHVIAELVKQFQAARA